MNKKLIAAALLCGTAALPIAAASGIEHADRPFYGFFLSNPGGYTNADESKYGFALMAFLGTRYAHIVHIYTFR